MKIWAKLISENRIMKDFVYTSDLPLKFASFELWLRDVSKELDISTPVILPSHYKNFRHFHNVRFRPDDFVDELGYDALMLEDCKQ